MSKEAALEEYFTAAASWDADRAALLQRSVRVAWTVASAAVVLTFVSGITLWLLVPLKSVQPYVVRVDSTTGVVDVVPELTGASVSEVTTRYLLTHYVTICQRYVNEVVAEADYTECGAFHSPKMNATWAAQWARSNPDSPLNRYANGTEVSVTVSSVTFLKTSGSTLAQVRYVTSQRQGQNGTAKLTHWIATVEYTYVAPAQDVKQRQLNPFGFRVVAFRQEPEVEAVGDGAKHAGAAP